MPYLRYVNSDKEVYFEKGKTLLSALLDDGQQMDTPCNGKGKCGKCRVKIVEGVLPEPTEAELKLLSKEDLAAGIRLACMVWPESDITVEHGGNKDVDVLNDGYMPEFEKHILVSKQVVTLERASIHTQEPYEHALRRLFNQPKDWYIDRTFPYIEGTATGVLYDGKLIGIEKGDTSSRIYGAAIDIGTTTVAISVVDMLSGNILADASALNAQKKYGADVLTRISHEMDNGQEGIDQLQAAIVESLNGLVADAAKKAGIPVEEIYEIAIAANNTMMHLLLGIDGRPIGTAPYAPMFAESRTMPAKTIGLKGAPGAMLYCLPSVSAFIGADITAGAYVCDLIHATEKTMFIDIGTNGEIVMSNKGQLNCCSCAAGPALEGMNISSGMQAAKGAIEDFNIEGSKINYSTIGGLPAQGICGSGVLAILSELLRVGAVQKGGALVKLEKLSEDDPRRGYIRNTPEGKREVFITTPEGKEIIVSQGDIRQIQLAKGAILSGFTALLNNAGLDIKELDKVVIAGQFGSHLKPEHLIGCGIIPPEANGKVQYVGNSSKSGAYMALMSDKVKEEMLDLSRNMNYIELSAVNDYQGLFASCLQFNWTL